MATTVGDKTASWTTGPVIGGPEGAPIPLEASGQRAIGYPRHKCIQDLLADVAAEAPNAVALQFGNELMTYGQLNERSNQLARCLQRSGVGREAFVGICLERSLEMIVAILATLKAGGAYLPLDAGYPRSRLAFMLQDAKAFLTITQGTLRDRFDSQAGNVILIEQALRASQTESKENLGVTTAATDLAYVMYTSGSTGEPKGVMIEHRSVVRLVKNTNFIDITPDDVFLQLAPISFDASTLEIWAPLLNGARLAIMPSQAPSLEDIGNAIQRYKVTNLWLTAGLFHLMVEQRLADLRPLRHLLAGGDVLSPAHVRKAAIEHPHCRIINGYGPTENTTFTCCHQIKEADLQGGPVPIGRPIANTRVYLLDQELRPVPDGENGELCAGGDGVARGYLNRLDLTAEKFLPDPFSNDPAARMYRTGDVARRRADGVIEFIGRTDYQVKIGGNRIELGEIESALQAHDQVKMAVVVVREESPREKKLVAYVIPRNPQMLAAEALRLDLQERVPAFMIPAAFVMVDSFPLSSNGKVDRSQLPPPQVPVLDGPGARSQMEKTIAEIWKSILNLPEVGIDANFFDLGGDSLALIDVHARVQNALRVELAITDLFRYSTIASLASHLGSQAGEERSFADTHSRGMRQRAAIRREATHVRVGQKP
jgi:amino acid adenylation domain-containing protein